LSSVPDISVVVWSGVSGVSSVSGVAGIWSIGVVVCPLRISFGFTFKDTVTSVSRIVSTWIGRVDTTFVSRHGRVGRSVDTSIVNIAESSSIGIWVSAELGGVDHCGVRIGITLAKMVDTSVGVVDSIVYAIVSRVNWGSNGAVDLGDGISVVSVSVDS